MNGVGVIEIDELGDIDPHSASKAMAELAIEPILHQLKNRSNINVNTARAGNVIGGGDWSTDRLIPDCVEAWSRNESVVVRSPSSLVHGNMF